MEINKEHIITAHKGEQRLLFVFDTVNNCWRDCASLTSTTPNDFDVTIDAVRTVSGETVYDRESHKDSATDVRQINNKIGAIIGLLRNINDQLLTLNKNNGTRGDDLIGPGVTDPSGAPTPFPSEYPPPVAYTLPPGAPRGKVRFETKQAEQVATDILQLAKERGEACVEQPVELADNKGEQQTLPEVNVPRWYDRKQTLRAIGRPGYILDRWVKQGLIPTENRKGSHGRAVVYYDPAVVDMAAKATDHAERGTLFVTDRLNDLFGIDDNTKIIPVGQLTEWTKFHGYPVLYPQAVRKCCKDRGFDCLFMFDDKEYITLAHLKAFIAQYKETHSVRSVKGPFQSDGHPISGARLQWHTGLPAKRFNSLYREFTERDCYNHWVHTSSLLRLEKDGEYTCAYPAEIATEIINVLKNYTEGAGSIQ